MKKSASPVKPEKSTKRNPAEKAARKSAKKASRATSDLTDVRDTKKASQKKTLKSAAKELQKELNNRMNEVVTRIRKETKDKLKEVVKEATRRLDSDTERMFEQALHTIVRHYDSVAGGSDASLATNGTHGTNSGAAVAKITRKKNQTLNKDGSPRKSRASAENTAKNPGRKPTTGARRDSKPAGTAAAAAAASPAKTKPATASDSARRGPKPRVQPAPKPEATGLLNSADSPGTGEVSK